MAKPEKSLVKKALEYCYLFTEKHRDVFVFHNYPFVSETAAISKEIAKGEGLEKEEYERGIVAVILRYLGTEDTQDESIKNTVLINEFLDLHEIPAAEREEILYYVDFLQQNKTPLM